MDITDAFIGIASKAKRFPELLRAAVESHQLARLLMKRNVSAKKRREISGKIAEITRKVM
jgi:hypothetical protein